MKKHFILAVFAFIVTTVHPLTAQSTMTDSQVLEYVKQGMSEGRDRRQMAAELARRGVTHEQAERVRKLYESQSEVYSESMTGTERNEARLRDTVKEDNTAILEETQIERAETLQGNEVFGRNIFNSKNLTFEPSVNIATPPNYRLGPGDEVIIDIWGTSQNTIRQLITPEGTINIEKIGPVNLNGMTVSEAGEYMKKVLEKIYSGLDAGDGNLEMRLTLGNVRTIQINVMGEVVQPGTYSLSSFSTVFHALYRAGGVNEIGSLRSVRVMREGMTIATIDVYEFILHGKTGDDIRLQEGDVIIVPAYESLVTISGNVKRPMKFELKKHETLSTLIEYAGGFTSDAYTASMRVVRQNGEEYEINTVKEKSYSLYEMRNGDMVTAEAILNRFTNKLEVRGAVYRPGIYQLSENVNTVRSLVNEAKGLTGDAFTNRAVIRREREDLTTEIISVNIRGIITGILPDIELKKNDILYIPSIHDLEERGDVTIYGEVAKPDSYTFSDNMTLEDLVIRAGGLLDAASTARIDIFRRIRDPKSENYTDSIGRTFRFSLKDGFVINGRQGFVLQPFDQVYVRRSPGYQAQQNIKVTGEVLFGGIYAMTNREERLSDAISKAGGATPNAYLRGAKLIRVANEEEKRRMAEVIELMSRQFGKAMMDSLGVKVSDTFSVGIDLEKAVGNPGSEYDLVLREGDIISVPKLNNTVTVNGAVMMPNTVGYLSDKNVNYYLDQAGGYALNAKKSKKFVIYMNGHVARIKGRDKDKIEPGCEIVVPSRSPRNRASAAEILSYALSIGSFATMFATITNLVR